MQRVLGRGPVTDNNQLCVRCFARFTPEFGVATTEVSLVMMAIGMFGRRPTRMDEERFADFAVRSMRAHGGTADRHGGVIDQLPDTGNLVALWIPRMAGLHHARRAIEAGQDLSRTIGRDKYLPRWMPGGVVVDTATGLVGVVGALGTALEFHAADDTTMLAAAIADWTTTGQFVVTRRAAAAGRLRVDRSAVDGHTIEAGDMVDDFFVIPTEAPLWWE